MKQVEFFGCNVVFAKNQPQYLPFPAWRMADGEVIICWELTDEEIEAIVKNRRFFSKHLTFNKPFHPITMVTDLSDGIELK